MATTPSTNINIPYSPFLDPTTGRPSQEWLLWLMNPNVISFNIATALPVTSGGTGLSTIPTNGQLLIGNGTGYTLNPLTPGSGITIGNGAGTISVTNSGVLSILAGSGISASTPAGNVTVTNTGVLSFAGGSTGLTPAAATVGAVSLAGTLVAGYGGTGLNTYAVGDIIYASGATALSRLADVATGNALISGGVTTAPSWGKIGLTTHVSGTLPIGNGGTNGTATATAGAIAYGTGSAYAFTAAGTSGQVLTSAGAGTPIWATPTTGTVTAVSVVSANGLAGTSSGGATPALTLSTTVTGVVKGNGTALSAATAATDYVAPSAYASVNGLTMATARLLGRTTASTGAAEEISVAGGLTLSGGTLTGTSGTVTAVSIVSANGLAGSSSGGATPALTLSTTITGLLKGNGTAISAATSGTDYAPATSGTSILYGNGSGGFSNVTIGTGVAFTAGTLSATGSGGTVTSVAALTLGTTGTDLSSTVANGTTTPVITLQVPTASATNRGALSAADWTTFNNKGSGTVTSVTGTAPVVSSGGATPAISMAAATTSVNGYLTSTDWNTFNGKQPAGSYLVSGGALGTPSSGTVTNLTGTASININGTVGATSANTGAFTTVTATGTISNTGTSLSGSAAASSLVLNASGNLGLGVTPSSWASGWKALQFSSTGGSPVFLASSGDVAFGVLNNAYYNGSNYIYQTSAPAAQYYSASGIHYWLSAASGTAGNAITFAQGMNLSSTGLSVTGIIAATGSLAQIDIYRRDTNLRAYSFYSSAGDLGFYNGSTTTMTLASSGIVTMSAYGAGAATFSASGVISSVSDETWKIKDGAPFDPDGMLNKLQPGYWYYNDEKKEIFGKDRQLGFYAQNVNSAIGPEAAPEPEEGKPWGYYDRSVLAITVMSLQKALATIKSLTERINKLEQL